MRPWGRCVAIAAALTLAGCSCGEEPSEPGVDARATVGPEGGIIDADGLRISIPQGALTRMVDFEVVIADSGAPEVANRVRVSRVFKVTPDDVPLLLPATVTARYAPESIPEGVSASLAGLWRTDSTRAVERLTGAAVDEATTTASGEAYAMGSFWVTVPAGPRPEAITISPEEKVLFQGETVTFTVEVRDQSGRVMPSATVVFTSSRQEVALVDPAGVATGVGPGIAEITARAGGVQAKAKLQVISTAPYPRGFSWENPIPQGNDLLSIKGAGETLVAVGTSGTFVERTAGVWRPLYARTGTTLHDAAVRGTQRIAVGVRAGTGVLVRHDGQRALEQLVPDTELLSVWAGDDYGVAVGNGPNVAVMDAGGVWRVEPSPVTEPLLTASGSTVVGARGAVYQRSGQAWIALSAAQLPQLQQRAVIRGNEAFAISSSVLRRFADGAWTVVPLPASPALTLTALGAAGTALLLAGLDADGRPHVLVDAGSGFVSHPLGESPIRGLWGTSATELYAVGDRGAIWGWDGQAWTPLAFGPRGDVVGIAAFEGPDVFAAGNACADPACSGRNGFVMRRNAYGEFELLDAGVTTPLSAIGGISPTYVWAVGEGGRAYHFDGQTWYGASVPGGVGLTDVVACPSGMYAVGRSSIFRDEHRAWTAWDTMPGGSATALACAGDGLFAVGDYAIARFDASGATALDPMDDGIYPARWRAVWATMDGRAFIGGDARYLLFWNGGKFEVYDLPANVEMASVRNLWGTGFGNVWAAGARAGGGSFLIHFNGAFWHEVDAGVEAVLTSIHGLSTGEMWLGGERGSLLHGRVQ